MLTPNYNRKSSKVKLFVVDRHLDCKLNSGLNTKYEEYLQLPSSSIQS